MINIVKALTTPFTILLESCDDPDELSGDLGDSVLSATSIVPTVFPLIQTWAFLWEETCLGNGIHFT